MEIIYVAELRTVLNYPLILSDISFVRSISLMFRNQCLISIKNNTNGS